LPGSGAMAEVVQWAAVLPVGVDKRMNADYDEKGG